MPAPRKFRAEPFEYHAELSVDITTLTNEGRGIGRVPLPGQEGTWVVMVSGALPGERVRARIYRNHKNYSDADLAAIERPSLHRIVPRCPLAGTCGGCQYQHLAYEQQLVWKRQQTAELLERLAGLAGVEVAAPVPSPREFGYRSKITPHFQRPEEGRVGPVGFLKEGSRHALVDVPECAIATPALNERLKSLRDEVRAAPPGRWKKGATLLLRESADGRVCTAAHEPCTARVAGLELEHLAGDFFQNNPFILGAFVAHAIAQAAAPGLRFLVDAYCGSGLFALVAARQFEAVAGVEISASAVERAQANAARNGITNATFLAASAEAIFASVPFAAEHSAVLIDPPRAGCTPEFIAQLLGWAPRRVVYVSCNPATQMRDLRLFADGGWRVAAIQPFDLFPQTKHLECVVTLVRGEGTQAG